MKNKFSYLNILLILFLCLIGFSPQKSIILPINYVYAETSTDNSYTGKLNANSFQTQIGGVLGELDLEATANSEKLEDITSGITMFIGVMGILSSSMQGFALAVSACVIAWAGLKIMNSGQRNVIQFIKNKREISNALLCVLFITGIPFLVRGILEFKPPSYLLAPLDDSANGSIAISDIVSRPKSGLVTYITENESLYKPKVSSGDGISKGIEEESKSDSWGDMIIEKVCTAVLNVLTFIIYSPLLLITTMVGAISFYPVSLDTAMYGEGIVNIATEFFKGNLGTVSGLTGGLIISGVAAGLSKLTTITNLLYFIMKKFTMICIEFVCYYYGIMHLLGKEKDDVGKFLQRLAKCVIGITLFPFIVEFLLDVDGMISSSILRITGTSFPGFGIMSVLSTTEQAKKGFTVLVLSILMCAVVFSLAKSFFIRRIEITFYYIASPAFFLKDMMSSSGGGIDKLSKTMLSAIFLGTVYAPVLALVNLMITFAVSDEMGTGFVYYALVIAMLLMGKGVLLDIIRSFAGSSSSAHSAEHQFSQGLSGNNAIVKTAKGIAGTGAALAAYTGAKAIHHRKDIVGGIKSLKGQGFKGGVKKIGAATGRGIKNGFVNSLSAAGNKVKSEYWKKYNQLDKRFGNVNHRLRMESAKNKNEVEDRNDVNAQELDLMKLENQSQNRAAQVENETRKERAKAALHRKYPNDVARAEREYAKYEEIFKSSGKNSSNLEKYRDFQTRGNQIARRSNSPEVIEAMQSYDRILNELPTLHESLDTAMKEGRVDDIFRINKDIERRQKFLAATEASILSIRTATNAKSTRDASLNTLQAIHSVRGNIQAPILEVRDENSAQRFVKEITAIPEVVNNVEFAPIIERMNTSLAQQDLGAFQVNVQEFALAQRSSNLHSSIKGTINTELGRVLNVSPTRVREHATVIQTGIDLTSGPQATEYYRTVEDVANSSTTTISDYIAMSSGSNTQQYQAAQSGVVSNVLKANTTNDIVQAAQREARLNNGELNLESLHTIIRDNGGTRTISREFNELRNVAAVENEKFRESIVNIPTVAEYGLPCTPITTGETGTPNPTGENNQNSGEQSTPDPTNEREGA